MKMFSLYLEGIWGVDELFFALEDVFRHVDEFEQFKKLCLCREANRRKEESWFFKNYDEAHMKNNCERIDHSYTTIPSNFPMSIYTGQTGRFYETVINHKVVSVPQGSEGSFTFKAKNKHEEALFKIEDERYELDQAINLNCSTLKAMEEFLKREDTSIFDSKLFTNSRMSWIYQMVNKNATYIDLMREHPDKVVPRIYETIKSIQSNFIRKKEETLNHWKTECIKHWSKSLDHKSFYFRQNEKKKQLIKEFTTEIKSAIENFKIIKWEEKQKLALNCFTGLEGLEISSLKIEIDPNVDQAHPMLLNDPLYLEHFAKLPQFRFMFNDTEVLKILMKYLYVCIHTQSGQQVNKQKDVLISFSKNLFKLGFVKKNMDNLKAVEIPDELLEQIKNPKMFYEGYINNELKIDGIWEKFFQSTENEAVVNIGSERENVKQELNPLKSKSIDGIVDSEPDEDSDIDGKENGDQCKPFMSLLNESENVPNFKNSRFLPQFQKDQVLLYSSKLYYYLMRYLVTLYERLRLAKNVIAGKLKIDIKLMKEEYKIDTTKLEEDFDKLVQIRFK
jgi:histone deacetylase complex regulatory component SIN3